MNRRNMIAAIIVVAVLLMLGAFALLSQKEEPNSTNTTTSPSNTPQATTPATTTEETTASVTVTYTDNGFDKSSYTMKKGERVEVLNTSTDILQISSDDHPSHLKNTELNMVEIEAGGKTQFTPTRVGTWGVHNHLNPSRTTTFIVTE